MDTNLNQNIFKEDKHTIQKYKHVLFDLDGTIYNTEFAYTTALYAVVKKRNPNTTETYDSLLRYMGTTGDQTNKELHLEDLESRDEWLDIVKEHLDTIKPFDGMMSVIKHLHEKGVKLGIITARDHTMENSLGTLLSPFPDDLKPYFDISIGKDEANRAKPYPDPILKYIEITGCKKEDILFIGDTQNDIDCAKAAGVDFALALWGARFDRTFPNMVYLSNPWDIINTVFYEDNLNYRWYKWAKEIQAIGQIGLAYSPNIFDKERFERCRELAVEMLNSITDEPLSKIKDAIAFDKGFATPKLDTRGAVFNSKGQIMLVKERLSGKWSLPGGWCDEDQGITSNTIKEVYEEAGMHVRPIKFVALLDKNKRNTMKQPAHIFSAFMLCLEGDGDFEPNSETLERRFFDFKDIPVDELRIGTTSVEQLKMCFDAYNSKNWVTIVD